MIAGHRSATIINRSARMRERVSSHFVRLSVCLSVFSSVSADLKDGGLLVLQRDMNLNWTTSFNLPLF